MDLYMVSTPPVSMTRPGAPQPNGATTKMREFWFDAEMARLSRKKYNEAIDNNRETGPKASLFLVATQDEPPR